jgi:hypothetical protein
MRADVFAAREEAQDVQGPRKVCPRDLPDPVSTAAIRRSISEPTRDQNLAQHGEIINKVRLGKTPLMQQKATKSKSMKKRSCVLRFVMLLRERER